MIKAEKIEFFGENETIYFNINRINELERLTNKSAYHIFYKQEMDTQFCADALTIGMQHHYPDGKPKFWLEKIGEAVDNGKGTLPDIFLCIAKALDKTGIVRQAKEDEKVNKGKTEKNV